MTMPAISSLDGPSSALKFTLELVICCTTVAMKMVLREIAITIDCVSNLALAEFFINA